MSIKHEVMTNDVIEKRPQRLRDIMKARMNEKNKPK